MILPDRVAFVAGTLGRGGAERQLFYMLRTLVEAGAHPVVACLTTGEHWEEEIGGLGVPVVWFGRSANPATRVFDLIRVLRPFRPAFLQSAHFHTNLYTVGAARAMGALEIGAIRGDARWSVDSLGRYGRYSLRVPRHIAVNSLAALEGATEFGVAVSKLTWLPNVVDLEQFHVDARRESAFHLVSVGRFVEVKRHDRFLFAVHDLVKAVPDIDVRATMVGEGPLEGELRALAARLGLAVDVVTNPSMPEVYSASSILVLTSENEGTPNVVLEAMASGLPVVAYGVGGVPDIIGSPDVGTLVAPGDGDGLVAALVELSRDPKRRAAMGAAARSFIEAHHSPTALTRSLSLLYRRVRVQPWSWPLLPPRPSGTMTVHQGG